MVVGLAAALGLLACGRTPLYAVSSVDEDSTGELYVAEYNSSLGLAAAAAPLAMYWHSSFATNDGTLIEWGASSGSDNGVREFDPLTGEQTYVYANNDGTLDQTQHTSLAEWYIPRLDSLVVPARGQFHRATGEWPIGDLIPSTAVVGEEASSLLFPDASLNVSAFVDSGDAHQAWSRDYDAGVIVGGGLGGDNAARRKIWFVVPSAGIGAYAQPYYVFERDLPALVGDAAPHKLSGRDGATFLGDYLYWVGGGETLTATATPHFFRLRIVPHLTSLTAPLEIERLPDAPAAFRMGLLRADPHLAALLCVTELGIFTFDPRTLVWRDVTPTEYVADYAPPPTNGLLPGGVLGDYLEVRNGVSLRAFVWRPGNNSAWDYDFGGENHDRMYRRFRAITLARR